MKLIRKSTGQVLLDAVKIADTPWKRLKGLIFTRELEDREALWLRPCQAIHMFGMRYAIDLLFLDARNRVVHMVHRLKPNRLSPFVPKAYSVLEMRAGILGALSLEITDEVIFSKSAPAQDSIHPKSAQSLNELELVDIH